MDVSVLGFGCSPLLGRVGRRSSLQALAAAYDSGINFFDTARSYGYGEGEKLLGDFLRGKRNSVAISTKFGIMAVRQAGWKRFIKPVIRLALKAAPAARKLVQKQVNAQFQQGLFSVKTLRESVDESLRKLQTDHVDTLWLHDAPVSVLEQDDLLAELRNLVTAGKIRVAGISADTRVVTATLQRRVAPLSALQFPCNLPDLSMTVQARNAAGRDVTFVANQPFGGVSGGAETRAVLRQLSSDPELPAELRTKLAPLDDRLVAEVVLNVVTDGTGIQVVIPSMVNLSHLRTNVAAMHSSRFSSEEIARLRSRIIDTCHAA